MLVILESVQPIFYSVVADGSWPVYYLLSVLYLLPISKLSQATPFDPISCASNTDSINRPAPTTTVQHVPTSVNPCLEFNKDVHKRAGKFIKYFKFKSANLYLQLQQSEISKIVSNNRQGKTTQSPRCSSDQQIVSFIVNFASSLEIYSPGLTIRGNSEPKSQGQNKNDVDSHKTSSANVEENS